MREEVALFAVWLGVASKWASSESVPVRESFERFRISTLTLYANARLMVLAALQLGFVCAISWMEAFSKFKASTLPKCTGFEIGGFVFSRLIVMEWAIVLPFAWLELSRVGRVDSTVVTLGVMSLQLAVLPVLLRQAEFRIVEHSSQDEDWAAKYADRVRVAELRIADKTKPAKATHLSYVVLELIKTGVLAYAIRTNAAATAGE